MSLNYSFTEIKDWKKLHRSDLQHRITDSIVWTSLTVGFSGITEANYIEFHIRCKLISGLYGSPLRKGDKHYDYTLEDIKRRIGLSTNVSNLTTAGFSKDLRRRIDFRIKDVKTLEVSRKREADKATDEQARREHNDL